MPDLDGTALADALMALAKKAADTIEKLSDANETMRRAALGVLPDGTPVEDMLQELSSLKQDYRELAQLLALVRYQVNTCTSANAFSAVKNIRAKLDTHRF